MGGVATGAERETETAIGFWGVARPLLLRGAVRSIQSQMRGETGGRSNPDHASSARRMQGLSLSHLRVHPSSPECRTRCEFLVAPSMPKTPCGWVACSLPLFRPLRVPLLARRVRGPSRSRRNRRRLCRAQSPGSARGPLVPPSRPLGKTPPGRAELLREGGPHR